MKCYVLEHLCDPLFSFANYCIIPGNCVGYFLCMDRGQWVLEATLVLSKVLLPDAIAVYMQFKTPL